MSSGASTARRGLGRGFEVLIGGGSELAHVPVDQIHPNPRQPRKRFESEGVAGLADSIRAQGLIQPIVIRPRLEGGYELIAGERRWRAARDAGIESVPAVVRDADDRETLLLGLVENVAREDLSPVEEARAYALLLDEFGLSLGDIAERVGKAKPTVSNRIRLLELPDDVLAMINRQELTEGHARAVLAVPDQEPAASSRAGSCGRGCPFARPSVQHGGPARAPRNVASRRSTQSSPAGSRPP